MVLRALPYRATPGTASPAPRADGLQLASSRTRDGGSVRQVLGRGISRASTSRRIRLLSTTVGCTLGQIRLENHAIIGDLMRLNAFESHGIPGLELLEVSDLSDVIVLAGPNGVGKTRLLTSLIQFFRAPTVNPNLIVSLDATSSYEQKVWEKSSITTTDPTDCQKLRSILQRPQKRKKYRSTVLNFDSDRSVTQIKPYQFSWDVPDPYDEDVGWDLSYSFMRDRYQDVRHSLFKLVEYQRRNIANQAIELKESGSTSMPLDFQDPLDSFRDIFYRLLAPKRFLQADAKTQKITYEFNDTELDFNTLSSGEREVINIAFDFLLRSPSHCIVFFDEPELHLHPELSYKLLQALSTIGHSNQFIFSTHSPEIISASIENSVIFLTPPIKPGENQAVSVNRDDETHHALNLLGQSIGIISLGKKIVIIEGSDTSLDKQTYGAILRNEFPEFVLVPAGGKGTIRSFDEVRKSILNKSIWGVDFFMVCDGDAALDIGPNSLQANLSDRLKLLPRYHLENYFLDEEVLAGVFAPMENADSWLTDPQQIAQKTAAFATETIPLTVALRVSAAAREEVGNIDIRPKGIGQAATLEQLIDLLRDCVSSEASRVKSSLDFDRLADLAKSEFEALHLAVTEGQGVWKRMIPGRIVFNRFAGAAHMKPGRLKRLYLQQVDQGEADPFSEIRAIFDALRQTANDQHQG